MAAVMKALSANGVTKDDVKSTNITLNHQTQNRGTKHQQTVYVAQNQVDATIHDLSSVGAVVDAAVKAGATSVGDIRFQLSNQLAARQKALSAAVKGAEQTAQIMAPAAGTSLGPVVSIRE